MFYFWYAYKLLGMRRICRMNRKWFSLVPYYVPCIENRKVPPTRITWPFKLIIVISNTNTNRSYKESSSITTTSSKSRDELTTKSKGMSSLIDCSHLKRIKHGTVVVGTGWPFWLLSNYKLSFCAKYWNI